jgi:hypothetical protein
MVIFPKVTVQINQGDLKVREDPKVRKDLLI